ncbi:MAG: ABC transporter permease, partial [Flammeovirgaceae bacterium]|nr:ABC transporter permease [Flammeovirgaceae bacterium]
MEVPKKITPPAWATKLLAWYCKPDLLEDLQGDLNEYFDRNVKANGVRKAKLIYVIDVIKFFRLYTIRKPEFLNLLISWIMIGSYIKTSGRSMVRNKLFSAINIIGLAVSMSLGLVLIAILSDVLSYDRFHTNYDRIHRVISRYEYLGDKSNSFMATTSLKAGRLVKEEITGIEDVAILHRGFDGDVKVDEKTIPINGLWANDSFFKVFSFELVEGNAATALKDPYSIILTQTAVKKLFGNEEALGKAVIYNNDQSYKITGIVKDPPFFSHIHFEMLGSLSTKELNKQAFENDLAWDNVWDTWVYLVLPKNTNI